MPIPFDLKDGVAKALSMGNNEYASQKSFLGADRSQDSAAFDLRIGAGLPPRVSESLFKNGRTGRDCDLLNSRVFSNVNALPIDIEDFFKGFVGMALETGSQQPGTTSISLLLRVKEKDEKAWERLIRIYAPLVHRWCHSQAGMHANDIPDVAQDVFRAVAVAISRFRRDQPGDSFRKWLKTITINKVRDHLRKDGNRPVAIGGQTGHEMIARLEDSLIDEDPEQLESDEVLILRQALNEIREEFRELTWRAFWLSAIDGRSTDDIADELQITQHAVRQSCYRVRRRLRQEMTDLID